MRVPRWAVVLLLLLLWAVTWEMLLWALTSAFPWAMTSMLLWAVTSAFPWAMPQVLARWLTLLVMTSVLLGATTMVPPWALTLVVLFLRFRAALLGVGGGCASRFAGEGASGCVSVGAPSVQGGSVGAVGAWGPLAPW